ncbi:right-handed parallel beta-helix repeat-containing protein [Nitrospira sp. M1]
MPDHASPQSPEQPDNVVTHATDEDIVPPTLEGGKTLFVDATDAQCYPRPSAALKDAGPDDQVFVKPGIYEDRVFAADRNIRLIGAGRDKVQIFSRRGSPLYLQRVSSGRVEGLSFRYVGSDQHSAMNILDSVCTITKCRILEGILSGVVMYGPECRPTFSENEVCYNRESGIFSFAGARPYISQNTCFGNHHFGIAVRDDGTSPDIVRNTSRNNMLSGILLFHSAKALILENHCHDNQHWGIVMTPDCQSSPEQEKLLEANSLGENPRGSLIITHEPLAEIGR